MPIICNNCGQNLPDDAAFCTKCGAKVTVIRCSGCGAVLTADAKFCPNCGTPVGDVAPPVEPVAPVERQTVEVRKVPTEPEITPRKATQSPPIQTAATDAPKQAPNHFEWKYWSVSILRGYGTTRNDVEVTDEDVVITSKLNKRAIYDATTVPLKSIASVEVWEKVSLVSALMVVVLAGGLIGLVLLSALGVTAIDLGTIEGIGTLLVLAVIVALFAIAGLFRIHHWRITIKTHKEPKYAIYELSSKPADQKLLLQIQDAIMSGAGIQGEPIRKKSKKLIPAIVISALVLVVGAVVAFQELYQIRALPEKILSDKEARATAWVEMRGDLAPGDDIIAEITGGQLAKPTAAPRYEDGSFLYQYVKYIYDITISNSAGETASGTVTATVGFSVKPFHSQPEAIIFDSFDYSEELISFVAQQQTSPDFITGWWLYDPDDLISDAIEEEILSYNASWDGQYQSVMAMAAIKDSLAGEDMDTYMEKLSDDWGLRESDMLFLVYNNGESCYWMANQAFFDYFTFDDYDGLQEILDAGYQADAEGNYESALINFYSFLNLCYTDVYRDLSGNDANQSDLLPISDSLELTYTSGAGAWQTNLILYSDGSFEGSYSDSDMGDRSENYPYGTVYLCSFIGHFSDITQINDYTYSMALSNSDMTITTGGGKWIENGVRNIPDEWVEDGVRYVPSGPVGLEQGTNFYLYTPDAPIGELPMDFLDWWPGFYEEYPPDTLSCYGLYNWDGGNGFFSYE